MVAVIIRSISWSSQLHLWSLQGQLYGLGLGVYVRTADQPRNQEMEKGCVYWPLFWISIPSLVSSSLLLDSAPIDTILQGCKFTSPLVGKLESHICLWERLEFLVRIHCMIFSAYVPSRHLSKPCSKHHSGQRETNMNEMSTFSLRDPPKV